jgi:hypothetical protein
LKPNLQGKVIGVPPRPAPDLLDAASGAERVIQRIAQRVRDEVKSVQEIALTRPVRSDQEHKRAQRQAACGYTLVVSHRKAIYEDRAAHVRIVVNSDPVCEPFGAPPWLPTPEDVIVQKHRWVRNKDMDDAREMLAGQGPETLDMAYVEKWCAKRGAAARRSGSIPPL